MQVLVYASLNQSYGPTSFMWTKAAFYWTYVARNKAFVNML
jgi:hypothetical protein